MRERRPVHQATPAGVVSSKDLAREAVGFVWANRKVAQAYATPILPVFLTGVFLEEITNIYSEAELGAVNLLIVKILSLLVGAYGWACFILGWHRVVLKGPDPHHIVKPFALKPDDVRFIKMLFTVFIPLAVLSMLGFGLVELIISIFSPKASDLAGIIFLVFFVIACFRISFIIPAIAIGVPMKIREAMELAEGWCWKLFITNFRAIILIGILFMIYTVAVTAAVFLPLGEVKANPATLLAMFLLEGVPTVVFNIFVTAVGATILSRLYKKAMEYRTQRRAAEMNFAGSKTP